MEHILEAGNTAYNATQTPIKLTKGQKHNVLEKMSEVIFSFNAYVGDEELAKAAEALVRKHPCLKQRGSDCGWLAWQTSLFFKMGNYRHRLSRAGCLEVAVNSGKRSQSNPDGAASHANIKKARKAELNYLPNFPKGENVTSSEQLRLQLLEEISKAERDQLFIDRLMNTTFALRRKHIIVENPSQPVSEVLENWPALVMESQVI